MALSPTQLTLRKLRADGGYDVAVVEHWNHYAKCRQDLFGVIDILAVGKGETVAVQCTSYSNVSARVRKIADAEALPGMRSAGWRILVHGWHKKAGKWVVREVDCSRW